MIVIELLSVLVSGVFLYPRTAAEPINRRLGNTVRGGLRDKGSNEMSAYRGVAVYE